MGVVPEERQNLKKNLCVEGGNYKYQQRKHWGMKHANTSSDPLVQFTTQSGPNLCNTLGIGKMVETHTQMKDTPSL